LACCAACPVSSSVAAGFDRLSFDVGNEVAIAPPCKICTSVNYIRTCYSTAGFS